MFTSVADKIGPPAGMAVVEKRIISSLEGMEYFAAVLPETWLLY
jgi:hypothetical protein